MAEMGRQRRRMAVFAKAPHSRSSAKKRPYREVAVSGHSWALPAGCPPLTSSVAPFRTQAAVALSGASHRSKLKSSLDSPPAHSTSGLSPAPARPRRLSVPVLLAARPHLAAPDQDSPGREPTPAFPARAMTAE